MSQCQWRGLAAAGQEFRQLEYATDDTLKLSGDDLTPEQHSCADELASHVASNSRRGDDDKSADDYWAEA
jgi:hypothetical protein